jgi:hypothetical protein
VIAAVVVVLSIAGRYLAVVVGAAVFVLVRLSRPSDKPGVSLATWMTLTLLALSPVGLGFLILTLTPTYFRPLLSWPFGVGILVAFAVVLATSYVVGQVGIRQGFNGRVALGSSLVVVAFLLSGAASLLILLGPAAAILLIPRQS